MKEWAKAFLKKYKAGKSHPKRVKKYCARIFDLTQGVLHNFSQREFEYLKTAAYLHDVGYYISSKDHHKNSYSIIMKDRLEGFNDREKEIIANLARYHRSNLPKDSHENFAKLDDNTKDVVRKLGGILKLADGLDNCEFAENCEIKTKFNPKNRIFCINFLSGNDFPQAELNPVLRKKDLFENAFDVQLLAILTHSGKNLQL